METEHRTEAVDIDKLRSRVAMQYEFIRALPLSKNPNDRIEGELINLGAQMEEAEAAGADEELGLYFWISLRLTSFGARRNLWSENEISDSIEYGRNYQKAVSQLYKLRHETPDDVWGDLIEPQKRKRFRP